MTNTFDEVFFLVATPTGHDAYWNPRFPGNIMQAHVETAKATYQPRAVNYMVTIQGTSLVPHYLFQEVTDPNLINLLTNP